MMKLLGIKKIETDARVIGCFRSVSMKLALTTIRNADIQTNLLSNASGELVSTYETFQRQSIGAVPENRASPFFFFSFLFYLQRTRVC